VASAISVSLGWEARRELRGTSWMSRRSCTDSYAASLSGIFYLLMSSWSKGLKRHFFLSSRKLESVAANLSTVIPRCSRSTLLNVDCLDNAISVRMWVTRSSWWLSSGGGDMMCRFRVVWWCGRFPVTVDEELAQWGGGLGNLGMLE
jgi:hypothetical protein